MIAKLSWQPERSRTVSRGRLESRPGLSVWPDEAARVVARRFRRGWTMIELLIATAIIALLLALIVPAVQSARESARRMDCSSRLRQIGIAVHEYHNVYNGLPMSVYPQGPLATLGSYLSNPNTAEGFAPVMRCPSDSVNSRGFNYAINAGTLHPKIHLGMNGCWNVDAAPLKFSDLVDGASNTAMFSEWLRGNQDYFPDVINQPNPPPPNRADTRRLIVSVVMPVGAGTSHAAAMAECEVTDATQAPVYSTFRGYYGHSSENVAYFHELPPNSNSCFLAPIIFGNAVNCPSSQHRGGANVLFADGSAKFVSQNVARTVWKAIGTRNGGEGESFE